MSFNILKAKLKDGTEIGICKAKASDAEKLLAMIQEAVKTADMVLITKEDVNFSIEQEIAWIESYDNTPNSILLLAKHNEELIGVVEIRAYTMTKAKHIGMLGITLAHAWRGRGLGQILINTIIDWCKEQTDLEIIELNTFTANMQAVKLYEKLGFEHIGHAAKYYKQPNGEYVDRTTMMMNINKTR